ncbi:pyridoxal-dependent decarboxylase, partial [Escherichia coli]|nr:pyridoxal-dependent decarboxylase [Escherichia coli]MCK2333137.1 pyridoxal-dependent decarboxylase [Escherichia coli]
DGNGSHASTLKSPSYTKSVSWQHYPAGQVIAQYYEFLRLGLEGYTKVQNASYQVAAYLADEIAKLGPYE